MSEVATTQTKDEIIAERKQAWASFGEQMTLTEMQLNANVKKIKDSLIVPERIEDVPKSVAALKEAKQMAKSEKETRLNLTANLDRVTTRLMQPEKEIDEALKENDQAILKVKLAHEAEQKKKIARETELTNLRQRLINYKIQAEEKFKSLINEAVLNAYTNALDQGISVDSLGAYKALKRGEYGKALFVIAKPAIDKIPLTYVSVDELNAIIDEVVVCDPVEFANLFAEELENKFSDYEAALLNKEDAINRAKTDALAKDNEIKNEALNESAAAKVEAAAAITSVVPELGVRLVKKTFKLDMEENETNAYIILSAFLSNREKLKLGVKKWFKLSIENMIVSLESHKNKEAEFNCTGLKWKIDSKN